MGSKPNWLSVVSVCSLVSLAACAFGSPSTTEPELPEEYGFYALDGHDSDDYVRLDGDREWELKTWAERSDLGPDIQFIVYDPALSSAALPLDQRVVLQYVAWVRSEIAASGDAAPPTGSKWVVPDIEESKVLASVRPLLGRADAALITPQQPLEPGLYAIRLRTAQETKNARLGVHWPAADKRQYSARHCVDRYVEAGTSYRPCATQAAGTPQGRWGGLQVYLVEPEARVVDGQQVVLVRGVIVNRAQQAKEVPLLQAQIRDSNGRPLTQWTFAPVRRELAPGQSTPFSTQTNQPAGQLAKVTVQLVGQTEAKLD